jgi:hypothetical protein
MPTKEPVITIKVGDWATEYHEVEPNISGEDDLVGLVTKQKMNTAKAARLGLMAREFGNAPADILPENKPLLNSGAAVAVSSLIARRHVEAQTPSGNTYSVREFVAPVRDDASDDPWEYPLDSPEGWEGEDHEGSDTLFLSVSPPSPSDESYAPVQSEEASGRAWDYLLKRVPGYIYGRLKIVAVNGGDVKAAAEELKGKIDELVERLG